MRLFVIARVEEWGLVMYCRWGWRRRRRWWVSTFNHVGGSFNLFKYHHWGCLNNRLKYFTLSLTCSFLKTQNWCWHSELWTKWLSVWQITPDSLPQMGPMLAPWTLLSGTLFWKLYHCFRSVIYLQLNYHSLPRWGHLVHSICLKNWYVHKMLLQTVLIPCNLICDDIWRMGE